MIKTHPLSFFYKTTFVFNMFSLLVNVVLTFLIKSVVSAPLAIKFAVLFDPSIHETTKTRVIENVPIMFEEIYGELRAWEKIKLELVYEDRISFDSNLSEYIRLLNR